MQNAEKLRSISLHFLTTIIKGNDGKFLRTQPQILPALSSRSAAYRLMLVVTPETTSSRNLHTQEANAPGFRRPSRARRGRTVEPNRAMSLTKDHYEDFREGGNVCSQAVPDLRFPRPRGSD